MKAGSPGLVLVDSTRKVIYANAEAIEALCYPETPSERNLCDGSAVRRLRRLLPVAHSGSSLVKEFCAGDRRFSCRIIPLHPVPLKPSAAEVVAIFLEPGERPSFDLSKVAAEFHLTERERETLEFLLHGLTSKEIAGRMHISPNTVKAFLRLIMVKMGASTRVGIFGKVFEANRTARLGVSV